MRPLFSSQRSSQRSSRIAWPLLVLGLAATITSLSACVDQDPAFRRFIAAPTTYEVGGALVAYDSAGQRFAVLREGGAGADARLDFVPWHHAIGTVAVSGDAARLLVLDPKSRTLGAIDPAAKQATTWALPSEFTALTPGADGKTAVLWHANGGAAASSLVNPAEVGLVDLTAAAAKTDNPRVGTIIGLSRSPLRVEISPEIVAADGKHRIVWVEAVSVIGLADFGPGGVRTLVVPLTPPTSTVGIVPMKTAALVIGATLHLYLIASNSNDVVHLSVDVGGDKLSTSIDQIASGKQPVDLLLFGEGANLRIATLNAASQELAVLNPTSGAGTFVSLAQAATVFVPYVDANQKPWALLWHGGQKSPWLQQVELGAVEKKKGKAVDVLKAELPVRAVLRTATLFALQHQNSVKGLSFLEPATGKLTSFAGTGTVQAMRLQGDSLFVHGRISGASRLSRIDLATLQGSSENVTPGADSLHVFGEHGVAVTAVGLGSYRVALFASGDLKTKPEWLEGIFLTGLFDRKEVSQ